MSFRLSDEPIDVDNHRRGLQSPSAGAFVSFEGWVRNHNDGRQVEALEYSAYAALADKEGARIVAEALERFEIEGAFCVHRIGNLAIGDLAVWAGASAAHRDAAFAACQYLIDEVKQRVPIWKRERYESGAAEWVNCAQPPTSL